MIKEDICLVILKAKLCSVDLASEYVDAVTFGHKNDDEILARLNFLGGLINDLETYIADPKIDITTIKLSDKGKFSLDVNENSLSLNQNILTIKSDLVNCLTTEDICEVFDKILIICPNC